MSMEVKQIHESEMTSTEAVVEFTLPEYLNKNIRIRVAFDEEIEAWEIDSRSENAVHFTNPVRLSRLTGVGENEKKKRKNVGWISGACHNSRVR